MPSASLPYSLPPPTDDINEIERRFHVCVKYVQNKDLDFPVKPTPSQQLFFYGRYKQATVGNNMATKPSLLNPVRRAMWSAHEDNRGKNRVQAMSEYVEEMIQEIQQFDFSKLNYSQSKVAKQFFDELNAGQINTTPGNDSQQQLQKNKNDQVDNENDLTEKYAKSSDVTFNEGVTESLAEPSTSSSPPLVSSASAVAHSSPDKVLSSSPEDSSSSTSSSSNSVIVAVPQTPSLLLSAEKNSWSSHLLSAHQKNAAQLQHMEATLAAFLQQALSHNQKQTTNDSSSSTSVPSTAAATLLTPASSSSSSAAAASSSTTTEANDCSTDRAVEISSLTSELNALVSDLDGRLTAHETDLRATEELWMKGWKQMEEMNDKLRQSIAEAQNKQHDTALEETKDSKATTAATASTGLSPDTAAIWAAVESAGKVLAVAVPVGLVAYFGYRWAKERKFI